MNAKAFGLADLHGKGGGGLETVSSAPVGRIEVEVDNCDRVDMVELLCDYSHMLLRNEPIYPWMIREYETRIHQKWVLNEDPRLWPEPPVHELRLFADFHPQNLTKSLPYHRALALRGCHVPGYVMSLLCLFAPDLWTRLVTLFGRHDDESDSSSDNCTEVDQRVTSQGKNELKQKRMPSKLQEIELFKDYDYGEERLIYECHWCNVTQGEICYNVDLRTALNDLIIFFIMAAPIKISPEQILSLSVERTQTILSTAGMKIQIPEAVTTQQLLDTFRSFWTFHPALTIELLRDLIEHFPQEAARHQQKFSTDKSIWSEPLAATMAAEIYSSSTESAGTTLSEVTLSSRSVSVVSLKGNNIDDAASKEQSAGGSDVEKSAVECRTPISQIRGLLQNTPEKLSKPPTRFCQSPEKWRRRKTRDVVSHGSMASHNPDRDRPLSSLSGSVSSSDVLSAEEDDMSCSSPTIFPLSLQKGGSQVREHQHSRINKSSNETIVQRERSARWKRDPWRPCHTSIRGDSRRMFQAILFTSMSDYLAFHGMRLNKIMHSDLINRYYIDKISCYGLPIYRIPGLAEEMQQYVVTEFLMVKEPFIVRRYYTEALEIPFPYWAMANVGRYQLLKPVLYPKLSTAAVAMARLRGLRPVVDMEFIEGMREPSKGIYQLAYQTIIELMERLAEAVGYDRGVRFSPIWRQLGIRYRKKRSPNIHQGFEVVPTPLKQFIPDPIKELEKQRSKPEILGTKLGRRKKRENECKESKDNRSFT